MLSEVQVTNFVKLYESHFGKKISRENAYRQGVKLVRLIELIYKSMTIKEYEILQERRRNTK